MHKHGALLTGWLVREVSGRESPWTPSRMATCSLRPHGSSTVLPDLDALKCKASLHLDVSPTVSIPYNTRTPHPSCYPMNSAGTDTIHALAGCFGREWTGRALFCPAKVPLDTFHLTKNLCQTPQTLPRERVQTKMALSRILSTFLMVFYPKKTAWSYYSLCCVRVGADHMTSQLSHNSHNMAVPLKKAGGPIIGEKSCSLYCCCAI